MKRSTARHRVLNPDGHAIGLDIGATGVRAAVLTPHVVDGRPTVTIHGAGRVDLEPGVVVKGVVHEPSSLSSALKQLWAENRLECRNVVLGAASHQVLVRELTIPALSAEQRAKALPYQAKDIVALPIDEVVLDFRELGEPDPETNMVSGLLIASPRAPIAGAVAAVERANLRVARVDLSSFGLVRAMSDEQHGVEAIVDLGAHLTTIVIHDHGVPRLVRTIARGGAELTEQLADRMSISIPEAEHAKCSEGLEHDNAEVVRSLVEGLRPYVGEIRTSVGYLRRARDGAVIDRIVLTGGGANLRGIVRAFTDQLGIPVELADPLQHITNRDAQNIRTGQPGVVPSAVSVGLAMGAAA